MKFRYASIKTLALPLRFYCALAVSATIRVILTKISNRSGIAVQWNVGLRLITRSNMYEKNHFVSRNLRKENEFCSMWVQPY